MPEDDDELHSDDLRCVFHAAEFVLVDDVACDADAEDVADSLIEDDLDRIARVHAREDRRERILTARSRGYLGQPVATPHVLLDEASVTLLQLLQGRGRRYRGLRFRCLNSRGLLTRGVGGSLRESPCRDGKSKGYEPHREWRSSHKSSLNVRIYHNTHHTCGQFRSARRLPLTVSAPLIGPFRC